MPRKELVQRLSCPGGAACPEKFSCNDPDARRDDVALALCQLASKLAAMLAPAFACETT